MSSALLAERNSFKLDGFGYFFDRLFSNVILLGCGGLNYLLIFKVTI